MIQYEREKMSARAECVEAIDNRPERAHAALTDCGDVEDAMASWQKRIERDIAIDDRAKGKSRWRSTIGPSTSHIETSSTEAYIFP